MTRRLDSDNLYKSYNDVFNESSALGIIEEISMNSKVEYVNYLPHKPGIKENSTTKVRPVFDASAGEKSYPFLNQCLEFRTNLMKLIPNILFRFRKQKYRIIADIEKAFLQICIRSEVIFIVCGYSLIFDNNEFATEKLLILINTFIFVF